jgi:hypothetical protein
MPYLEMRRKVQGEKYQEEAETCMVLSSVAEKGLGKHFMSWSNCQILIAHSVRNTK